MSLVRGWLAVLATLTSYHDSLSVSTTFENFLAVVHTVATRVTLAIRRNKVVRCICYYYTIDSLAVSTTFEESFES